MRPLPALAFWIVLSGFVFAKPKPREEQSSPNNKPVTELTEAARASIVTITQIGRGGAQEALGAGFVISVDGLIATNRHVIGSARRINVQLSDGTTHEVTSVHATDPNFDLAILRIEKHDLKPLALGDSEKIKQGQPVIAIGHPQGLQFSVVEGVVSAMREVEGARMIQLAIPIEQGNSGGPLLDLQGRVQGILTLKSAITDNLGFAHPVNQLKLLINNPNPVPMSRWLTIGVLDARAWKPLMGSRWTQHAGVIRSEEAGDGFGGRAVCVKKDAAPTLPFEAAVTVKLDDEAGAAGLAFCSNGGDQHYGFYPSDGKLRLTRFNGADVFSWTILADVPSTAYKKGDWNTLRVHVDEEKIQCFVNDKLVTEQHDDTLRGGNVGICKFRKTKAQFKAFQIGVDLRTKDLPDQLAAKLKEDVDSYLQKSSARDQAIEKLITEPAAARMVLQDRAKSLEDQAASLRRLEKDVHRESVTRELVSALQRPGDQAELLHAGLLIAKHDNPELDVSVYLRVMDRMVDELKNDPALKQGTVSAAARLTKYLFEENGFHGSRGDDISDLSNSYLNEVLDDREGIPITLSIVYLELARRLGVGGIYGVSLPGRFMLGYDEGAGDAKLQRLIDVFDHGKLLSPLEAEALIFRSTGAPVDEKQFQPATPRAMILRMLYSMTSFAKKPAQSLPYLDLILAIDPDSSQERLNRALTRMKTNNVGGAKKDLEKLMEDHPPDLNLERIEMLYRTLP